MLLKHVRLNPCYLWPVQGQPLWGAAVVAAGLSERGPRRRTGGVVQDLLLRHREPPFTEHLPGTQAAVTAATALRPISCPPATAERELFVYIFLIALHNIVKTWYWYNYNTQIRVYERLTLNKDNILSTLKEIWQKRSLILN